MILFFCLIALGCVLLYFGGDLLLEGAVNVGQSLGWSQAIIGLVLVSLGTSAPELFVSAGAAIQGFGNLAAGNVVGSNIVNIAIVLGVGALIIPLTVDRTIRTQQIPVMILLTVMSVVMLMDGSISRVEGAILLLATIGSFTWTLLNHKSTNHAQGAFNPTASIAKNILLIVVGIVLLVAGAESLIQGGIGLGTALGVSQAVMGLTVTAIGTSLPEIAATLVAVFRKESDLAVGNVVGSNILNLGLVMGFTGAVSPFITGDLGLLPLLTLLGLTLFIGIVAWKPGRFNRWAGALLLMCYVGYISRLVA